MPGPPSLKELRPRLDTGLAELRRQPLEPRSGQLPPHSQPDHET